MVKHNNVLPNGHFHKDWDQRIKMWFDQPMQKKKRRLARKAKAAAVAPRPAAGAVRPVVRCTGQRYKSRARAGRGFTLEEIKGAGMTPQQAQTIGISVDHRRTNKSEESLKANIARLKLYSSKLVVFKKSQKKEAAAATQLQGALLPIKAAAPAVTFVDLTAELKKNRGHGPIRQEWVNAKYKGARDKKKKEAAEKAAAAKPAAEE